MKIYQSLQKHFEILGVNKVQLRQATVFNLKNVFGLFVFVQNTILTCAYLLFKCETFAEYADSYYISSTVFGATINYIYVVVNMKKVFDVIRTLECIIEKRKCCFIFIKCIILRSFKKKKIRSIYFQNCVLSQQLINYNVLYLNIPKFTETQ